MKRLLVIATLLVPTVALAQSDEVTLKVTNAEVNVIGKALGSMPFNEVAALINKLQLQIAQQQKAAETPKAKE